MNKEQAKDERMESLKEIEKKKIAESLKSTYNGSGIVFKHAPDNAFWEELNKLLDELAGLRAEAWITNHSKEKPR